MLTQVILVIIIALSFLFALILFSQRNSKAIANLFLSVFLFAIALQFFLIFLTNIKMLTGSWIKYNTTFGYLYGPSIYYYIIYLIDSEHRLSLKGFVHYSPPILVFIGLVLIPDSSKFFAIFMYLSLLIYVFVSFKLILGFKKKLSSGRWKKPNSTLRWLQFFLILFVVLLFLDFIDQTIFYLFSFQGISMVYFGLILLISWMFFKAFNQPELFRDNATMFVRTKGNVWELRDNDTTNNPDILFLKASLETNLFENKWFLLPNLSLEKLAKKLDTTPQLLSNTINTCYSLNFSSFINSLRIDHAKKMLKNFTKAEKSISEIMYDCGFVSKSSFNTIFKNETGVTPSQFRALGK